MYLCPPICSRGWISVVGFGFCACLIIIGKKVAKEKTDLGGSQAQRTAFLLVGIGGRACFVVWLDLLLLLLFSVSLGFGCHGRRRKSNRRTRRRRVAAATSTSGGARRSERSHATGSRALQAFLFSRMGVRDRRQHHS